MSHRGEVVKSGYLIKSPPDSKVAAQWHKRWFVLADSRLVYPLADRYVRLEYYQSEGNARRFADPKGVVNLNICKLVTSRETIKGHKHVFDVQTSKRVYHLAADSVQEKVDWIMTLNRVLFVDQPGKTKPAERRSPPVQHRQRADSDFSPKNQRKDHRPLSYVGDPNAMSRPLPPVPTDRHTEHQKRPLPPTPRPHPLAVSSHSHPHLQVPTTSNSVPSTSPIADSPLRCLRGLRQDQRPHRSMEDITGHYEFSTGQQLTRDTTRPSQPPAAHQNQRPSRPKPAVQPKPKGFLKTSGSSDREYINLENGPPGEVDSEYSFLEESSVSGYDPNNEDYSHLGFVSSSPHASPRLRHTAPAGRPQPVQRRKPRAGEYENSPHIEHPDDDSDYSHLRH